MSYQVTLNTVTKRLGKGRHLFSNKQLDWLKCSEYPSPFLLARCRLIYKWNQSQTTKTNGSNITHHLPCFSFSTHKQLWTMQTETQLLEVIQLANMWNVVHKIIDVILIIKINQW